MQFVTILLFALSANADNFAIGLSYGMKKIHIPLLSNLIIACVTMAGTAASAGLAGFVAGALPVWLCKAVGAGILTVIGLYALAVFFRKSKKDNARYDKDRSGRIETGEALTLGLALTLNNVGLGVGAGIGGASVLLLSFASFIFSLLFLFMGNLLGRGWLHSAFGKCAEPISACLMIVLGILQLV